MAIFIGEKQVMKGMGGPKSIPADDVWKKLKMILSNKSFLKFGEARRIFYDWVSAPAKDDFGNAYYKKVDTYEELAVALIGNVKAGKAREEEEKFAWLVLGHLIDYEKLVLDQLTLTMTNKVMTSGSPKEVAKEITARAKNVYGPAAVVEDGVAFKNLPAKLKTYEPIERLYKKIALLHAYSYVAVKRKWFAGVDKELRSASRPMRKDNLGSLNEANTNVRVDRFLGTSIWAGTSGSTMDMINTALNLKISDPRKLTGLAYCIAAFFHFMPTSRSATHTFVEVMRGARSVTKKIPYNDGSIPKKDLFFKKV